MLAERLKRRDGSALAALYDSYGSVVYSIALRILRSGGDAEEVTQEVFLYAWEKADHYDAGRGSLIACLGTRAGSRSIDRLRERQSRDRRHEALAQESLSDFPPPAPGPERELALAEAPAFVRRAPREPPAQA